MEQFANDFRTTLAASIAAGDSSLTLASSTGVGIGTAPVAPFRIRIDNELILVGARVGTACSELTRGIEGTVAASHSAGAVLRAILTVAGLDTAIAERLPESSVSYGTFLVSGGQIVWVSAYTFLVSAATYYINGTLYNSPQTQVTLSAAHATLDRIDVVAVNDSSAVAVIEGTAAAQPSEPDVDPASQLRLGFILVTAATSAPVGASNVTIYAEDAGSGGGEWDVTESNAAWNPGSTINPRTGTKDIEGTSVPVSTFITAQKGAGTLVAGNFDTLVFHIRSKAQWHSKRSINIRFQNAGHILGMVSNLAHGGSFNFDSANTSTYQQIAIPLSIFAMDPTNEFNQIVFVATGTGGSNIGFYIDDIQLQVGAVEQPPAGLTIEQADARYVLKTSAAGGKRSWGAVIGDGTNVISTGTKGYSGPIPYAGTIRKVTLTVIDAAFTSGSIVVDIWKKAGAVPTNSDSITAAAKPTLSSATAYEDSTLTGWTPTVAVGDRFGWEVESASLVRQVHVNLEIE